MENFQSICDNVWVAFLTDMNSYFNVPGKCERYFNEYWSEKNAHKDGGFVMYRLALTNDPTPDYDWASTELVQKLSGQDHNKVLATSEPNTAYIIFMLFLTGPGDMVPPEIAEPKMKTRSCVGVITKSDTGYNFKFSDQAFEHNSETPLLDTLYGDE